MSAPIKCEKCGAKGFHAIQTPCTMGCGGLMYYDKPAPAPVRDEALEEAAIGALDYLSNPTQRASGAYDIVVTALRRALQERGKAP